MFAFMAVRRLLLIFLAVASVVQVQARPPIQDAAALSKEVDRLKAIETDQQELFRLLSSGTMVVVVRGDDSLIVRSADIRLSMVSNGLFLEAQKDRPDYAKAELEALRRFAKYVKLCQTDTNSKLAALKTQMSFIRTKRQLTEKRLAQANDPGRGELAAKSFGGTWTSSWGKMVLNQAGSSVTGTYEHQNGKITGTASGGEMRFVWIQNNTRGVGTFKLSADGKTLTGTWNYTDENGKVGAGGTWSATRQ